METQKLLRDHAWPHVGLIDNQGEIGTGFVVRDRYVLTALHVVKGASKVRFILKAGTFEAEVIKRFEEKDIALLQLSPEFQMALPPLPLGQLPNLPVAYVTWGYRKIDKYRLLQGHGDVRAWLDDGSLQLETRTQRPGMSGCPVAIGGKGGLRVVAIGVARYKPDTFQEDEQLAFAYPVVPLPREVIDFLGGLMEAELDEHVEQAAESLDMVYQKKSLARRRFKVVRNISGFALLVLFGVLWLFRTDPLNFLPALAILAVALIYFQIRYRELGERSYLARSLSAVLRSADSTAPVPRGFQNLLEAMK